MDEGQWQWQWSECESESGKYRVHASTRRRVKAIGRRRAPRRNSGCNDYDFSQRHGPTTPPYLDRRKPTASRLLPPDIFLSIFSPSRRWKCYPRNSAILGPRELAEKRRRVPAPSQTSIHEHSALHTRQHPNRLGQRRDMNSHPNLNASCWSLHLAIFDTIDAARRGRRHAVGL
jgi:hypothetical protein